MATLGTNIQENECVIYFMQVKMKLAGFSNHQALCPSTEKKTKDQDKPLNLEMAKGRREKQTLTTDTDTEKKLSLIHI